jgi:hypothetical protein
MDQPLEKVHSDLIDLDMIKGLEAYAYLVLKHMNEKYLEYDDEEENEDQEPVDDLHEFLRRVKKYSMGARQQLEQRMFGPGKPFLRQK